MTRFSKIAITRKYFPQIIRNESFNVVILNGKTITL